MNLFELFVALSLDNKGYKEGLNETQSLTESMGSKIQSVLGKLVTMEALEKAGQALVSLGKSALESYADYEQLVGGAELMFGDAYDYIAEKAKNAYSTVQMSQNDYLTQVNGFATGLKTALGGNEQAAAELADKIVTAEADVVAATGNSQEAVQNAFNGIMKSNYTMLDNLQIGITPTKEGFQEVIDKVNEWNKANGEATDYEISNLADCQSALVDYIEMVGMSGYAQNEASETISGSLASVKAAWQNLLTGLANGDADLGQLFDNMLSTIESFTGNVIPIVEEIIPRMGRFIGNFGEMLLPQLSSMVSELLPQVVDLIAGFAEDLAYMLPDLLKTLNSGIGVAVQAIMDNLPMILTNITYALVDSIPILIDGVTQLITLLAENLPENLPILLDGIVQIIEALAVAIIENAPLILTAIVELLAQVLVEVVTWGAGFFSQVETDASAAWDQLIAGVKEFFANAISNMASKFDEIKSAIETFFEHPLYYVAYALGRIWGTIFDFYANAISALGDFLKNTAENVKEGAEDLVKSVGEFFSNLVAKTVEFFTVTMPAKWKAFKTKLSKLPAQITDFFKNLPDKFINIGTNIVEGLWNGIKNAWSTVTGGLADLVNGLVDGVKDSLGIASPSKVFKAIGGFMAEGLGEGWESQFADVQKSITDGLDFSAVPMTADVNVSGSSASGSGNVINQTINVNREVATADELAKAIRIESRYGLMKGVALG